MRLRAIIIYTLLTLGLVYTTVKAQTSPTPVSVVLPAGASIVVSCAADTLTVETTAPTSRRLSCAAAGTQTPVPPTATSLVPTVTNTPTRTPTATTMPMGSMSWHAPGGHGGIAAHEHGDAPPQWILDAGYVPAFDHPANTPNENSIPFKHSAMKGWSGIFGTGANRVDWYGIFHLDQNPGGYASRFHSYQLWLRDSTGAVSHFHGWLDFGQGNNTGPNLIDSCEPNNEIRPQIFPMQRAGCTSHFENWYSRASGSGAYAPDFGFNLEPNYYLQGAPDGPNDPANPATWTPVNGNVHLTRRIEFAWYANRSNLRGDFWTTQWGDVVSGPTNALCDGLHTRTFGTKTYNILCLKQTIQSTLPTVQFPGNSIQRIFPNGSGANRVVLPN